MTAILGGLGGALMWATTTILSSKASRQIGAAPVLAGVMLVGLALVGPVAVWNGLPARLGANELGLLLISGGGNVAGLLLTYKAYRLGKVGIIAPITSTEGAVAALIAVLAGEHLTVAEAATLGLITVGIVLAAVVNAEGEVVRTNHWRAVAYAGTAALVFGASLYATGRVGAVAVPLAARRGLVFTRESAPLVVGCGIAEVVGFVSFTLGARDSLAVSAVIASQFAGLAALLAFVLYGERLRRIQIIGVAAIAVGVGVLSALHA